MGEVNIYILMDRDMLRTGSFACNQKQCQSVTWTVHKELPELDWRWLPGKQVSELLSLSMIVRAVEDGMLFILNASMAGGTEAPLIWGVAAVGGITMDPPTVYLQPMTSQPE